MPDNDKEIQIPNVALDDMQITFIDMTDTDVVQAGQYLYMKETLKKSKQEIAEFFGYKHRNSVYDLEQKWRDNGALEKARIMMNAPKIEDIRAVHGEVLDQWGNIVRTIMRVALHGKGERAKLEAAMWLHQTIIKPAMEEGGVGKGQAEADYANRVGSFNPNEIVLPGSLAKKIERLSDS